jgi:hypothetical protein
MSSDSEVAEAIKSSEGSATLTIQVKGEGLVRCEAPQGDCEVGHSNHAPFVISVR